MIDRVYMRLLLFALLYVFLAFKAQAQTPQIVSILVNSCSGTSEGTDEYVVFQTLNDTVFVDSLSIFYPSGGTYCNNGCGSNTNGNNAAFINSLNSLAACTPPLFIYNDTIPPGATVIVFTGNPPTTPIDFSSQCGNGQYYAVFSNNANTSGRFGNSSSTVRTLIIGFGGSLDTVSYIGDNFAVNADGNVVGFDYEGNASYGNIGNNCIYPLGVHWGVFTVYSKKNTAVLQWETKSEKENDYFVVERSLPNESDFFDIARIDAKNGGNSNIALTYAYLDSNLSSGIYYYRVRQVDNNGITSETIIRSVKVENNLTLELIARDEQKLYFNQNLENKTVCVYDISGRLLLQQFISENTNTLLWEVKEKGIYFVRVMDTYGNLELVKFSN
jgi:hypothetical protein